MNQGSRSILKSMLVLSSGTAFAKFLGIIFMPIITRMYSPEQMGILSVFMAVSIMLLPLGSLCFFLAIPLPKNHIQALNLVAGGVGVLVVMVLIISIPLYFSADFIFLILNMENLIVKWWLLPLSLLIGGLLEILTSWAVREKEFSKIAISKVVQTVFGDLSKISFALLGFFSFGLVIGQILFQFSGVLSLSKFLLKDLNQNYRKISLKRVYVQFVRFRDFPLYRLPSQILLMFSMQAPLIFCSVLYGTEVAGYLGLAFMSLTLPVSLFGHTTGQAYYAEIARLGKEKKEEIHRITKDIIIRLLGFSIIPFLVLLFFGPLLFGWVFGKEWVESGEYAAILSIYLLTQFVSAPIIHAFSVFDAQKEFLYINMRRSILIVMIFSAAYIFQFSAKFTIVVFSIFLAVHYLMVSKRVFRVINE